MKAVKIYSTFRPGQIREQTISDAVVSACIGPPLAPAVMIGRTLELLVKKGIITADEAAWVIGPGYRAKP